MDPEEYRYTQEHEWLCPEPEGKAVRDTGKAI